MTPRSFRTLLEGAFRIERLTGHSHQAFICDRPNEVVYAGQSHAAIEKNCLPAGALVQDAQQAVAKKDPTARRYLCGRWYELAPEESPYKGEVSIFTWMKTDRIEPGLLQALIELYPGSELIPTDGDIQRGRLA